MQRAFTALLSAVALASLGLIVTPAFAEEASDGKALYEKDCSPCHGMDGSGDTPAGKALGSADLRDPKYAEIDAAAVIHALRELPKHAAVSGTVTDAQLEAITIHIHELGHGSAQPGADASQ